MVTGTMQDAMNVLQEIPRVKEGLSRKIVEYFLAHPNEWENFKVVVSHMQANGYCVCGNFALDNEQKYKDYNLCEFCRDGHKLGIMLIPNLSMIQTHIGINGDSFWYQIIDLTDEQNQVKSIYRLVENIQHKLGFTQKITLVNALGTDGLAMSVAKTIEETVAEQFAKGTVSVVTPQLGLPPDTPITQMSEATLGYVFLSMKSQLDKE